MAYDINEEKSYRQSGQTVFQAAVGAVSGLEGKVLKQDAGAGTLEARFDKKIHGKVLGDRTEMTVTVATPTEGESTVIWPNGVSGSGGCCFGPGRKGVKARCWRRHVGSSL